MNLILTEIQCRGSGIVRTESRTSYKTSANTAGSIRFGAVIMSECSTTCRLMVVASTIDRSATCTRLPVAELPRLLSGTACETVVRINTVIMGSTKCVSGKMRSPAISTDMDATGIITMSTLACHGSRT